MSWSQYLFPRFEDPDVERAYVEQERSERIPATRFLAALAVVTLITYIGFNPMHFPTQGVIDYNIAAGTFIALLLGLFALTHTEIYVKYPSVDLIVFTLMIGAMIMLVEALAGQAAITGISRFGMAVINLGILVVFASIGFVANTRRFLAWALLLVVSYLVFLLQADRTIVNKVYTFTNFTTFFTFACYVNWDIDRRARKSFSAHLALEDEQMKTKEMLHNVLPQDVAQRLRDGEAVADSFSDVSVIFVDMVGFSNLAKTLSPGHLVRLLNDIFQRIDTCADEAGVEKVKTIGDAYLAVSGGNASTGMDAQTAIAFGQMVIASVKEYADETGINVRVRVGIHTGPVVGGVIGKQRLAYDYWGDTMNIASRIEGAAQPNGIAVSEATFYGVEGAVLFGQPELMPLKGVGELKVYPVVMDEGGQA